MLSESLMILISAIFVLFIIIILRIVLYVARKKDRLICTLTESQFSIENLKFEKTLELNLNELKSITYILESYIFDNPYSSSSIVASLNRLIIVKSNNEKINLLFITNNYKEMNGIKEKVKKIQLTHPFVKYKIGYI
jgi:hypothetical protein